MGLHEKNTPIIGKQALHDIGMVLDFNGKTIIIDEVLLPMRNLNNLQLKPSISRALKLNSSFAQEPVSTPNAPNALWKSWVLSMTKQIFQALSRTIACT
jgi:hypothetical protein